MCHKTVVKLEDVILEKKSVVEKNAIAITLIVEINRHNVNVALSLVVARKTVLDVIQAVVN
tara:strand:- start:289 stop:471 length:183 start_codon:yes stop_codon:yes gene_type:complete